MGVPPDIDVLDGAPAATIESGLAGCQSRAGARTAGVDALVDALECRLAPLWALR